MSKNKKKINPETYLGSLEPYFELVQNEYCNERDRKRDLETRGGIIITILVAITAVIFDKIKLVDIFALLSVHLTFILLIKIITGLLIYLSFIGCVIFSFKIIYTSSYAMFNISNISSQTLGNKKNYELGNIIIAYRDIIKENRIMNEKKAKAFEYALQLIIICSISICIFINL